jgi:hypothetical protein
MPSGVKQSTADRSLHDLVLEAMPDGAAHDAAGCFFCSDEGAQNTEGAVTTYTEDELREKVDAAVAAATEKLSRELNEIKGAQTASAIEAAVAEATDAAKAEKAELESKLDAAVLETRAATERYDGLVAFLDEEKAKEERAAELAALRDTRVKQVAEVASFTEEELAQRADRWAEMAAEDFERVLDDFRAITAKSAGSTTVPTVTAMTAAADGDPGAGTDRTSGLKAAFALRGTALDPRTV